MYNHHVDKRYMLNLQAQLLDLGYEDVVLKYLSANGKNATLHVTFKEGQRLTTVGLFRPDEQSLVDLYINADRVASVADSKLAQAIRDADTNAKPPMFDFRKFTGL